MRTTAIATGILILLAIHASGGGGNLDWVEYEPGMEKALKEGRPAVVYFTADW